MRQSNEKVNILLVDDHEEGLIALEAVLQRPQYNLIKARSGEEALGRILDNDFAVILMDVQMPGMDGFDTVHLIKQREKSKDIPVIFITAISKDSHVIHRGYKTGAVDYIFKPFDPTILASKVSVFVDLYLKNQKIQQQSELLRQSELRDRARQVASLQMESLSRYRYLADAIPHIIWKLHPDGTLDYCNRIWTEYSGLSPDESSGSGWQSAVHPEDLEKLLNLGEVASRRGEMLEMECRLMRASDGTYRWHMFRGVAEFGDDGLVSSWIVTNTDIEDLKMIEKDLIQAKEASLAANEAKSSFLANMSHEIRTPLGIVLGFAELLANPDISDSERDNCLLTVRRNGELLSRLIGDILDLSKIEAGHLLIDTVRFDLSEFLQSAIQNFTYQAQDKGIQLLLDIASPLPRTIVSDPMRLRQVLFNVVSNAIKFTEKGEVRIGIRLHQLENDEGTLEISVTDQGIGISTEQAAKLFQPFIQADNSTTRKYGGTGLGLSLSRKLAQKLGGDVVLGESRPDQGSTFIMTVSTGSLTDVVYIESLTPVQSRTRTSSNEKSLHGVRILVVEDAVENQVLLTHYLTRAGAEVEVANNGQEGVDLAMSRNFDIVLMDIQMPVLDGYAATRALRSRYYDKPILALTAYALKEEKERCLAAGCNDHLTKPLNRDELLKRVNYFLRQREASTGALYN